MSVPRFVPARALGLGLGLALLVLSACHRQPVGQVVAVVGGEEITRAELNAELRAGGDAGPGATRTALERLVERRLVARIARDAALDKSQDYLIRSRQLADALLGELLREQLAQALPAPGDAAVAQFLRDHSDQLGARAQVSGSAARALAVQALTARAIDQALEERLAAERARTPVAVQPGALDPPPPTARPPG